jgi:hypothetical protein
LILSFVEPVASGLGGVVGCLKGGITRDINLLRRTDGAAVWQQNYWERVIRSERELESLEQYLSENPRRWLLKHGSG